MAQIKRADVRVPFYVFVVTAVAAVLLGGCANAPSPLSPRGPAAQQLATLWWVLFTVAAVVFVVVMVLMFYALFRRRSGQRAGGT